MPIPSAPPEGPPVTGRDAADEISAAEAVPELCDPELSELMLALQRQFAATQALLAEVNRTVEKVDQNWIDSHLPPRRPKTPHSD